MPVTTAVAICCPLSEKIAISELGRLPNIVPIFVERLIVSPGFIALPDWVSILKSNFSEASEPTST